MNLLIDSGNTRLEWALLQNGSLISGHALLNEQITRHKLVETWVLQTPPERLAIACVSSTPLLELVLAVLLNFGPLLKLFP